MELETIIQTLKRFEDYVKEKYKADIIGVFGSYVRGEQIENSDVDILVRFLRRLTYWTSLSLGIFLEDKLNMKVDIVPADTVRKEIREQIMKETVYL